MKILIISLLTIFFLNIPLSVQAQSPSPDLQNPYTASSSYEMFYPIVAGKLPGESTYFLKTIREWIAGKLIFNQNSQADFHLTLSQKRLVESEKLVEKKDYEKAIKNLRNVVNEFKKSVEITKAIDKNKGNTKDLKNTLPREALKQTTLLQNLSTQVPENYKQTFIDTANQISDISKSVEAK